MSSTQEQPDSTQHPKEQGSPRKHFLFILWGLSEWMIVGPLLHARDGQRELFPLLLLSILPMFGVLSGIQALLFPERPSRWPLPISVGFVSTLLFLVAAPASLRLSFSDFKEDPYWLVTTSVGTVMAFAYLVATAVWWKSRGLPPDKSVGRTR